MALSTQPYKGARDFYPEDKRFQKYMFNMMRKSAERFGYQEYDAPLLEPLDLYAAKSGQEIVNDQTYMFEDRGGRQVAIRPEMTPTVSRMVAARRQELPYPLRWYSIPNLWRYERPQRGRLREHWQLNVDVFGLSDMTAEMEIIQVADSILKGFGATHDMYTIKINSRKLMDYIFHDYLELSEVQTHTMAKLIDRMHKIPPETFAAESEAIFTPTQRDNGTPNKLLGLLKIKQIQHLPEVIREQESTKRLHDLLHMLKESRVTNAVFDITVMRGFDYYTDIIFEVNDNHPDNNRSMFGGGRYDGLVGLFGVEPVPTVGFGMGDVTLQNFLEGHNLMPKLRPETDLYVILIGEGIFAKAQRVIDDLREMGVNVAVDLSGRKPDKQLKAAIKSGVNYAMFLGEEELKEEQFKVRNLHTGIEERHSLSRTVSIVKDYRSDDI
jgi:histidyl-tRNA synthetase